MLIVEYAVLLLISGILAVLAAEFQECYQKEQTFSIQNIRSRAAQAPGRFIVFVLIYLAFTVLAILFYQKKGLNAVQLPQYVFFWEGILAGAWIDFRIKKIPNAIFLFLLVVRCIGILAEMALSPAGIISVLISSLGGMLVGSVIVLACRLMSRGGVGAGDVKLFAIIGFYFGVIATMNILFYTTFLAAAAAIVLLVSKKAKMKSTLALGPFAFIGLNIFYVLLA